MWRRRWQLLSLLNSTTFNFIYVSVANPQNLEVLIALDGGGSLSTHSMKEDEGMMIDRESLDVCEKEDDM